MVIKIKKPLKSEYPYFREGLVLFTYLHLTSEEKLVQALIGRKVVNVVYETVQLPDRSLPLLSPMSKVAGRVPAQVGAESLQELNGGMGVLLGGVPEVPKGKVAVIGDGQAETSTAKIALGLGANVTILDVNPKRLQQLDDLFGGRICAIMSNPLSIELYVRQSDLVIGAVLTLGAKAPRLVTEDMIKQIKNGSVIIDIAIDQGGIFETTDKITIHNDPTYIKRGMVRYAVANMPGAVPHTSTLALNNATLPYALMLVNKGYREALRPNQPLSLGLNIYRGHVTNKGVAETSEVEYKSVEEALHL